MHRILRSEGNCVRKMMLDGLDCVPCTELYEVKVIVLGR